MKQESPSLNVLYLLNGLFVGGAEKHTLSLIHRLSRTRFNPYVVYLKPIEALKIEFEKAKPVLLECLNVKRKIDFTAAQKLAEWCDRHKIDLIVAVDPYPMLVGLLAKQFCREVHPKVVEVLHMTDLPSAGLEWQYQLVYRWLFRQCDEVFFVSRLQMEHWQRRGLHCQQMRYIHNGVDQNEFFDNFSGNQKQACRDAAGFAGEDFVIAICAALRPEKRHEDLIDTIATLKARGVFAKALIIGDGPRRAQIESRIRANGLDDDVHFTGMVSDVKPWISSSDCVVLTSHSVETFSIAALEAMALGKPVIATRIGGAEEQIEEGENGYLFNPGDLETFARHLAYIADNNVANDLGENARRRVLRDFTLDVMVNKYADAFEAHCCGRRP